MELLVPVRIISEWLSENLKLEYNNMVLCPYNNEYCSNPTHLMGEICSNQQIEKDNHNPLPTWWNDRNFNNLKDHVYPDSVFLEKKINKQLTGFVELPKRVCCVSNLTQLKSSSEIDSAPYAILSYVWGDNRRDSRGNYKDLNNEPLSNEKVELNSLFNNNRIGYNNTDKMTRSGYKALQKVVKVCQSLDIKYLWTDQLCIDQNNDSDKNQEIPKMGKYYGNATVTLIAIHINLGGKDILDPRRIIGRIVHSEWFSRVWIYQEGMLSQRTLFMFDDCLVDGGYLADIKEESGYLLADMRKSLTGIKNDVSTSLGWVNGFHTPNDNRVTIHLRDLIKETKNRKATVFIDSINSILGLLNSGETIQAFPNKYYDKSEIKQILENIATITNSYGGWGFGSSDIDTLTNDLMEKQTKHLETQQLLNSHPNTNWSLSIQQQVYFPLPNPQQTLQPLLDNYGKRIQFNNLIFHLYTTKTKRELENIMYLAKEIKMMISSLK